MEIETLAVHAGHRIDPATRAVAPPIYLSTTFERQPDGSYPEGYSYTRSHNPNREALETSLALLEGGEAAAAFASGSAATASIFQALAPGDHVLVPNDAYHGTTYLLQELFTAWGLQVTSVDMTDALQVQQAVRDNTRLLWLETPSNPLLRVSDIAKLADIAHQAGARCVCDNTWATPVGQRPFEWGADLIVHSTTKYLGGHSDVLGGIVVSRCQDQFFQRLRQVQQAGGAVPSPFDCWLVLRGVSTLPWRLRAHSDNALKLASFLSQHPEVEAVHYPGLSSHLGYDLACRQMRLFGGMLSFQVRGGQERAFAVAARVQLFTRATSLGAVESLIEHRASVEGPATRTPDNLLRVSVGLEHPDDLIQDLDQALATLGSLRA